jgi:hypothetical protein
MRTIFRQNLARFEHSNLFKVNSRDGPPRRAAVLADDRNVPAVDAPARSPADVPVVPQSVDRHRKTQFQLRAF